MQAGADGKPRQPEMGVTESMVDTGPGLPPSASHLCQQCLPDSSKAPSFRQPALIHTHTGQGPIS